MPFCLDCGDAELQHPLAKRCHTCRAKRLRSGKPRLTTPCRRLGCPNLVPAPSTRRSPYCSPECKVVHRASEKAAHVVERANRPKPEPIIYRANCRFCGALLESKTSYLGKGEQGAVCKAKECRNARAKEWQQKKALVERGPLPACAVQWQRNQTSTAPSPSPLALSHAALCAAAVLSRPSAARSSASRGVVVRLMTSYFPLPGGVARFFAAM